MTTTTLTGERDASTADLPSTRAILIERSRSDDLHHRDPQKIEPAIEASSVIPYETVLRTASPSSAPRAAFGGNPLWAAVAIVGISCLVTASILLAIWALHLRMETEREMEARMSQFQADLQELNAGISFDSQRKRLLLGMRDEIMRANPKVSLRQAYHFAQLLLEATEKYPSVDPLLFLALGIVESGFDAAATSKADARGLFQIWPATGRLLARVLQWEYSDELLYDPARNTEMAALYLDVLFSTYHDPTMVLAEYNGGPVNAGYLRGQSARVATETSDYVRKVIAVHHGLQQKFELGIDSPGADLYRALQRDEKTLVETSFSETGS
jgi:hypothetical protein